MHKTFRYPKFSVILKGSPTKFFLTVRQKFPTENRDTAPISPWIFFHTRKFLKHRRDPLRSFSVLWDKKFSTKPWCPPPLHENFWYQTFFETQTGSSTKFFGTVKEKNFDRKLWCPLLMQKNIFDTRNFLIHRIVPQQNFLVLWDR